MPMLFSINYMLALHDTVGHTDLDTMIFVILEKGIQ